MDYNKSKRWMVRVLCVATGHSCGIKAVLELIAWQGDTAGHTGHHSITAIIGFNARDLSITA
jgi:hypothetical protein